ncbi:MULTISPECIES: hypothetical protein [Amycolatopsis]|uniref:Uncharacterized protein n=1 Tax=Amycolatopsis bullii TaxID=941987 RepID=A0ABQ3K5U9_9PSEU|nr:hypothetical protein [Amycolatopsis bullii]GHG03485.1 hypothetical protein GCM10017567_18950 [Amycolatopsis bullii]
MTTPVHGVTPALYLTGTVHLVPLLTDAHSGAVPWTVAVIVAVFAELVVALLVRRRRRVPESSSSA